MRPAMNTHCHTMPFPTKKKRRLVIADVSDHSSHVFRFPILFRTRNQTGEKQTAQVRSAITLRPRTYVELHCHRSVIPSDSTAFVLHPPLNSACTL